MDLLSRKVKKGSMDRDSSKQENTLLMEYVDYIHVGIQCSSLNITPCLLTESLIC